MGSKYFWETSQYALGFFHSGSGVLCESVNCTPTSKVQSTLYFKIVKLCQWKRKK